MRLSIHKLVPDDFNETADMLNAVYRGGDMLERITQSYQFQDRFWYVARLENKVVGAAGAISYGPFGSVGMVGTHPDMQKQGIGYALMKHLVDSLDATGCTVSFLDATVAGSALYPKVGYLSDGRTYRYDRSDHAPLTNPIAPSIRPMIASDLENVIQFDAPCFGAPRPSIIRGMFHRFEDRSHIAVSGNGEIEGYIIAQNVIIGPWMARTPEVADSLLRAALHHSFTDVPRVIFPDSNQQCLSIVTTLGFHQTRDLMHMRRGGTHDPRSTAHLYGQASFMLG